MIRRPPGPPDAAVPFCRTFVRRSLRPEPTSRFSALADRAGSAFLLACAIVVFLGLLGHLIGTP